MQQEIDFVNVPEAAHILEVSPMTIRRYIQNGTLPAVQKTRWSRWKIARADAVALKQQPKELYKQKYGKEPDLVSVEGNS